MKQTWLLSKLTLMSEVTRFDPVGVNLMQSRYVCGTQIPLQLMQ